MQLPTFATETTRHSSNCENSDTHRYTVSTSTLQQA